MARTSTALVESLLGDDYEEGRDLDGFIEEASFVVDDLVTCAARKGKSYSPARLRAIETRIAAHLYCDSDQPLANKSTEGASGSFQGRTDMYLEGTKYGQSAVLLDPSGCLRALSKGNKASGKWLGKTDSEAQSYYDRNS